MFDTYIRKSLRTNDRNFSLSPIGVFRAGRRSRRIDFADAQGLDQSLGVAAAGAGHKPPFAGYIEHAHADTAHRGEGLGRRQVDVLAGKLVLQPLFFRNNASVATKMCAHTRLSFLW